MPCGQHGANSSSLGHGDKPVFRPADPTGVPNLKFVGGPGGELAELAGANAAEEDQRNPTPASRFFSRGASTYPWHGAL